MKTARRAFHAFAAIAAVLLFPGLVQAQVLVSQTTRLTFAPDPVVGIQLDRITRLDGDRQVDFLNGPPPDQKGLWEIHGTHQVAPSGQSSGTCSNPSWLAIGKFCIRPNGHFQWNWVNDSKLRFVWTDVQIPDAAPGEASLRVTVEVQLKATWQAARWTMKVQRNLGAKRASLDELHSPVLYVEGPITTRYWTSEGLESAREAQARARVLFGRKTTTPLSGTSANLPSANLPLDFWFRTLAQTYVEYEHPNPSQLLQFAALYNADPGDPGHGTMLYVGSRDSTGYKKKFVYKPMSFQPAGGGEPEWRFQWSHVYVPSYDKDVQGWDNTFGLSYDAYPAVTGTLQAETDDFWYDVCAYYRDFVEATGMVGSTFESNPDISDFKNAAVWSSHAAFVPQGSVLVDTLAQGRAYKHFLSQSPSLAPALASLASVSVGFDARSFLFLNNYRSDFFFGQPDFPGYPPSQVEVLDPGLGQFVSDAQSEDMHVVLYSLGVQYDTAQWPVPPETFLYERFSSTPATSNGNTLVDFGRPRTHAWHVEDELSAPPVGGVGHFVVDASGAHGLYIDGVSGAGILGYEDPTISPLGHDPHGGSYLTGGRQEFFENVRSMLAQQVPANSQPFVQSESVQEYLAGDLDETQQGMRYVPHHMTLYEPWFITEDPNRPAAHQFALGQLEEHITGAFLDEGRTEEAPRVPEASRAWALPLWQNVYHEYQPVNNMTMPLSTAGLANGPLYSGPEPPVGQGLTNDEWRDILCMTHAGFWASGSKPAMFLSLYDRKLNHPLIGWNGSQVTYDADAAGLEGVQVLEYIRQLHATLGDHAVLQTDWAGRFNLFGRAARPLPVAYSTPANPTPNATVANPTYPVLDGLSVPYQGVDPALQWVVFPAHELPIFYKNAWLAHLHLHEVPAVFHSVWKYENPTREHGILLTNWTDATQTWAAVFDPKLYGIEAAQSYSIRKVDQDGSLPLVIDTFEPFAINVSLPPRSAAVLVVD